MSDYQNLNNQLNPSMVDSSKTGQSAGRRSSVTKEQLLANDPTSFTVSSPLNNQPAYGFKTAKTELFMSPNAHMRRTFRERTFSKMGAGSIRGSIFALCSSAIGAGVLSLPYVLALNGWAVGIAYIALGAFAAAWSNNILAYRACEHDQRNYS